MDDIQLSQKGKELIEFYKQMANGFERMDEHGNISKVTKEEAYSLFNISRFLNLRPCFLKTFFTAFFCAIITVLTLLFFKKL